MGAVVFYTATIAFASGILVRSFVPIGLPAIAWMMLIAFACTCVWRRNRCTVSAPVLLVVSVCLFTGSLGMLRMEIASWSETNPDLEAKVGSEVTLEGVIVREPDVRETTTHLYVDTGSETILAITDRYSEYAYGDRIEITGELKKPEAFVTDLGRTFDYPGYLHARGVSYLIIYGDLKELGSGEGNEFLSALFAAKHRFMHSIEALLPEPHAGLGEGLLLGVKRALGEELESVFRKTGIIHIVVLSGYNIMLVVAFVMYVFAYLFGLRMRTLFGIAAITAFALVVGLSATVVRASIMAALLLFAQATGRTYAVMRALLFAGSAMLLLNPYLLAFDTGFQLSFLATMGLILIAPWLETWLSFVPEHAGRMFLTATLATQFFVLPILLYQIGEFSIVSVVVNVLVLPMVPIAMFLTFVTGMVGILSEALAIPFAYVTYLSLTYILSVAEWFADLPFASFVIPAFPFWVVPLLYIAMGYGMWRVWIRNKQT